MFKGDRESLLRLQRMALFQSFILNALSVISPFSIDTAILLYQSAAGSNLVFIFVFLLFSFDNLGFTGLFQTQTLREALIN